MRRFFLLFELHRFDAVFIHREAAPLGPPVWEYIALKIFRKKGIYDFDDAIWISNTSKENRLISGIKWHNKVGKIIAWSSIISAGNNWIRNYASSFNERCEIIPTTVDTDLHRPTIRKNQDLTIGWTGTHSTLKYLTPILPVIRSIQKLYNTKFLIIADKDPNFEQLDYEFKRFSLRTEIEDLDQIDVGLMPLPDTEWAKGKCGFKLIQYMALSKPSVGSPVGVNKEILGDGVRGMQATNLKDWETGIVTLLEDKSKREEMGLKGREFIEANFSKKANKERYEKLFRDLFN